MINITHDSLTVLQEELKKLPGQVVVDFWAPWCGPCRMVGPELQKLEEEREITLVKINVDANPNLSMAYKVASIPTMKFFRDGVENRTNIIGAVPKEHIKTHIS